MFLELQPLNLQTFTFYFAFFEEKTLHRVWQGITYILFLLDFHNFLTNWIVLKIDLH